jgi:hypothetical protein
VAGEHDRAVDGLEDAPDIQAATRSRRRCKPG